jgi:nucleoside-diphosphate-sugar epimerase
MSNPSSSYNILIIGGSGFLSGTIARVAVAAGRKVWAITQRKGNRE